MNTTLSVLCKLVVTIYFLNFRVVITLIIKRESTQVFQLVSTYLNMLNKIVCFVLDIVVINVNYDWYGHFYRYWYTDNIMNFRNTNEYIFYPLILGHQCFVLSLFILRFWKECHCWVDLEPLVLRTLFQKPMRRYVWFLMRQLFTRDQIA